MLDLTDIYISPCETHHLRKDQPLYLSRFEKVMKYHAPGLAPVKDNTGAFHVDFKGQAAYSFRYKKTVGFYEGISAVTDENGGFHIRTDGTPLYDQRYRWCGNFQEGSCTVQSDKGFFHINNKGERLYKKSYQYAGDFKDGVAVIVEHNRYKHILSTGDVLHPHEFLFLDVFHKGFARARDKRGWFHIDIHGNSLYSNRYAFVEPFYNDLALVQTHEGAYERIDLTSKLIDSISTSNDSTVSEVSGMMVGFWQTHALKVAVQLEVLEHLPAKLEDITNHTHLTTNKLIRLMRALWELDIVFRDNNHIWRLTKKGQLLAPKHEKFLAQATAMWHAVDKQWNRLPEALKQPNDTYHPCFKDSVTIEDLAGYQRALVGYAQNDFQTISQLIPLQANDKVLVTGSCARVIIPNLQEKYTTTEFYLYDSKERLRDLERDEKLKNNFDIESFNIFEPWSKQYNVIIFPRFLHYWPQKEAGCLLKYAKEALLPKGRIYIAEMLLNDNDPTGALLDLNMLVETGGCLRTSDQWLSLAKTSSLFLSSTCEINDYLTLLEFCHD